MRQYRTDDGHVFYDLGCADPRSMACTLSPSLIFGKKREVETDDLSDASLVQNELWRSVPGQRDLCKQCCSSDLCNAGSLCGTAIFTHPGQTVCYSCQTMLSPEQCNQIELCGSDYVCLVQEHTIGLSPTKVWTSSCQRKETCHRLQTQAGHQSTCRISCCNTDLCNNRCGNDCTPGLCDHGTCQSTSNGFQCNCYSGYTGTRCEQHCTSGLCVHGTCQSTSNGFKCNCYSGYAGTRCDQSTVVRPKVCEPDWVLFDGHCYYFSSTALNWDGAQNWCLRQRSSLAIVTSSYESHFLATHAETNHKTHGFWIGATDRKHEGSFVWGNGRSITAYTSNWGPGEPSDKYHDEDCVEIKQKTGWKWNDETCNTQHLFICKT